MKRKIALLMLVSLVTAWAAAAVQEVPFKWKFKRGIFQGSKDYTIVVTVTPDGKVLQDKKQVATVPAGYRFLERRLANPANIKDGAVIDEQLTPDTYTFKVHLGKAFLGSSTIWFEFSLVTGDEPASTAPNPVGYFTGMPNGDYRTCRHNETFSLSCQFDPGATAYKYQVIAPNGKPCQAERVYYVTGNRSHQFNQDWAKELGGTYRFLLQTADNRLQWGPAIEFSVNVRYELTLVRERCTWCNGSGYRYERVTCHACNGHGSVPGPNGSSHTCFRCNGRGYEERREWCRDCNGRGYVEKYI